MLVQPRLRLAAVVGSCTCVRTSMIALPMLSCQQAMDGYACSGTCGMLCSAPHVHVHAAFADVQPHVFLSLRTFSCTQYFKAACVSSNLYCALRAVHTGSVHSHSAVHTGSAHLAVHTGSVHNAVRTGSGRSALLLQQPRRAVAVPAPCLLVPPCFVTLVVHRLLLVPLLS
eukprot:scpid105243/ scgid23622/ 